MGPSGAFLKLNRLDVVGYLAVYIPLENIRHEFFLLVVEHTPYEVCIVVGTDSLASS